MSRRLAAAILVTTMAHGTHAKEGAGKQAEKQHGHGHGHGQPQGSHGNPADFDAYVQRLEDPARAEWQMPDRVVAALGDLRGRTVCDIGGGPGYFSLRFARATGERGHVFAVDVEPRMLEVLRERIRAAGPRNLTPVLALPDDPLLPAASCDVVLLVNTYHHFPDGPAYLRRLARALKPGGRIANVDFHDRETPVGPPVEMRVSEQDFVAQAGKAGLVVDKQHGFLPHQYFLVLRPR